MGRQARAEAFKAEHPECAQCGTTEELTIDHIRPRSKGGADHESNWQVLCKRDNEKKGDSVPEDAPPPASPRRRRRSPAPQVVVSLSEYQIATAATGRGNLTLQMHRARLSSLRSL